MVLSALMSYAQYVPDADMKSQIEDAVNKFTSDVRLIADKSQPDYERQDRIKVAKRYFYGKCDSVMWNGTKDIAKMQVTSLRNPNGRPRSKPMKNYLWDLYNLVYESVTIKNVGHMVISKIIQEGDHFVCTVQYAQAFKGVRPDGTKYIETNQYKSMVVRIDKFDDGLKITLWDCSCVGAPKRGSETVFDSL